jgi:hypothetical protein
MSEYNLSLETIRGFLWFFIALFAVVAVGKSKLPIRVGDIAYGISIGMLAVTCLYAVLARGANR